MLELLALGVLLLVGLVVGGVFALIFGLLGLVLALPFQILGGLAGLVFGLLGALLSLPFRLIGGLFALVEFGLRGLGWLVVLPLLVLGSVVVGGALLAGLVGLVLLPLLPLALLGAGLFWWLRRGRRRPAPLSVIDGGR